jgi:hypothetical protein
MMVRCFGILWRAMEFSLEKIPTIFHVICKLHNICMDWWIMKHPTAPHLGRFSDFSDVEAPPFSDDGYLWESFDITVGLDDVGDQPTDELVTDWLMNQYDRLNEQRCNYAARNGTKRNAIMEESWKSGIRFNSEDEIY